MVNEFGIIDSIYYHYDHWCTRYSALLISFFIASLYKYGIVLILYQLLLLILITGSIITLIKSGINYLNKDSKLSHFQYINYSLFIVSGIFYCTFNIDETWFWLSSSSTYLLSVITLIYGVSLIINKKNNLITYIALLISMLFIGGSNGSLSLFLLILAAILALFTYFKKIHNIRKYYIIKKILFSALILLIGFTILYIGPGNDERASFFEPTTIKKSLIYNFKYCGIIVLKKIPSIVFYLITFSIPCLFLGLINKDHFKRNIIDKTIIATLLLGISIYLFQLPITYKIHDIAPDRTLFPLCVFIYCYFCYIFYQIGTYSSIINKKTAQLLITITTSTVLIINCVSLWKQYPIVKKYATAYDKRIETIKHSADKNPIILKPLPPSGFIYSNEISKNPYHFTNQHLKKGLSIDSDIIRDN